MGTWCPSLTDMRHGQVSLGHHVPMVGLTYNLIRSYIVSLPAHQLTGTGGLGQCRTTGGRHGRRANAFGQHLEGETQ